MRKELPSFIDFEASSLSDSSYPIEVAWSLPDGSIEAHIISPEGISPWTDWSKDAQAVHGIRRAELLTDGKSPFLICRRMNEKLSGRSLYSDNPYYDRMWLEELFSASFGSKPTFTLGNVDSLLESVVGGAGLLKIEAMKRLARREVMGQHRAVWDVEYLILLYKMAAKIL